MGKSAEDGTLDAFIVPCYFNSFFRFFFFFLFARLGDSLAPDSPGKLQKAAATIVGVPMAAVVFSR